MNEATRMFHVTIDDVKVVGLCRYYHAVSGFQTTHYRDFTCPAKMDNNYSGHEYQKLLIRYNTVGKLRRTVKQLSFNMK
jgi:hypothetical protein